MDSDEEAILLMDKQDEDLLHTSLSDVLGALFRTHKSMSLSIVQYFYKDVLSSFLNSESTHEDKKFAIFVIDDILEFIDY